MLYDDKIICQLLEKSVIFLVAETIPCIKNMKNSHIYL